MFYYSCPKCNSRTILCCKELPETQNCPGCEYQLVFAKIDRTLLDIIKDSFTPKDLISSLD